MTPDSSACFETDNSKTFTSSYMNFGDDFEEISSKPHLIAQEDLNDLVNDKPRKT